MLKVVNYKRKVLNIKGHKVFFRVNRQINVPMVRVTKDGENLGVMRTVEALDMAYREGLDLVETVPNAKPPVAILTDYAKYRYDVKKKLKKQVLKQKSLSPKEIRIRPVINENDVKIKIDQLKKFISEKRIVSVNMRFKNREMIFKDQGRKIIEKIVEEVSEIAKVEKNPCFAGNTLSVRFHPK